MTPGTGAGINNLLFLAGELQDLGAQIFLVKSPVVHQFDKLFIRHPQNFRVDVVIVLAQTWARGV